MSAEYDESFEEAYPGQYAEFMEVFHLAEYLEQFAQTYSEDYADELEDGCTAQVGHIDLGGELTTSLQFKAERIREELYKGMYGKVITAEYEVKSLVKQAGLTFNSFPKHIQECIEEMDDFDEGYLQDETTQFAVEYELVHTITTEGDFLCDQALSIYVDEAVLRFPDAIVVSELHDETDEEPEEDSVDKIIDSLVDDDLMDILGFDDLVALDALSKQVVSEYNNADVLNRFYNQINAIRYLTKPARMSMVRNIVEQLFLPDAA